MYRFSILFLISIVFGSIAWAVEAGEVFGGNGERLDEIFAFQIGGFTVWDMTMSLLIVIATLFVRKIIVRKTLFGFLKKRDFKKKKKAKFYMKGLRALEEPLSLFILVLGIFIAVQVLPIDDETSAFISKLYRGGSMLILAWGLLRFCDGFVDEFSGKLAEVDSAMAGFMPIIKKSLKIVIIIVGALLIVDNLGFDVKALLATLGIGGAALAFASKDTVANLFGSLCIILDRPFKVGDWIEVSGKINGDVMAIGMRSTQIKTFMATTMSIPNSVLANEVINNWSRMPKRRVKQFIGLTYDTPPDTVQAIVDAILHFLKNDAAVNQDYMLVNFTDFSESSLDIMVYYFTKTTVWKEYLDERQRINCEFMKIIAKHGSSIAFPSRTLYFANGGEERLLNTDELGVDPLKGK